jgi:hypothetical protein
MELMHENHWRYNGLTGTNLGKFISDLIASFHDAEVLKVVRIIFQLAELLAVHHHLVIQT